MNIDDYLARIGYIGPVEPTLDVLKSVHRGHALSVAYENLDVMLQTPVGMEPEQIFDKIVRQRRGGWCYEMNGLLGWALTEIGFQVTRMTGGVMRQTFGDDAFSNHLVLKVDLDGPWIADVGIGDFIAEPIPLHAGEHVQDFRRCTLTRLEGDEWRAENRDGATPPSFDLINKPADERALANRCAELQTDPKSMFRTYLICQRMTEEGGTSVIGRKRIDMRTREEHLIESEDEFLTTLRTLIGEIPDRTAELWPYVVEQHAASQKTNQT